MSCLPKPGQKLCGDNCVDKTDPDYGCDDPFCLPCTTTNATAVCKAGACAVGSCDPGYLDCDGDPADGCEVEGASDPAHCGDCNNDCTALDPSKQWQCVSGQCQLLCPAGTGDCNHNAADGCETDVTTTVDNCGSCGRACSTANGYSAICVKGLCSLSCNYGWGDCNQPAAPTPDDGCETNVLADPANCGACGEACSKLHSSSGNCTNGTCVHVCQAGWNDCNNYQPASSDDGCQTHVGADPDHCGSCYRACSAAQVATRTCQSGLCNSTCQPGWGNCKKPAAPAGDDGCETWLQTNQDCGACGHSCSTANADFTNCNNKGQCAPSCKTGWADCTTPVAPAADDGCECHGKCSGGQCV